MSFAESIADLAAEIWRKEDDDRLKRKKRTGKDEEPYGMRQAMYRALDYKGIRDLGERKRLMREMGKILGARGNRVIAAEKKKERQLKLF